MTSLKDSFLEVIEATRYARTWEEAAELHERTKTLVHDFGKSQGLYSANARWELMQLRNETLTKVCNLLHRTKIAHDVAELEATRRKREVEHIARLDVADRQLEELGAELEREQRARPIPGHAFEGLVWPDQRRDIGYER
ncbi:hypothetical protein ABZ942_38555 [Nocardia sp. NPDC046473]|uniref:hypothetical protein n=1 Tax=Nocardia sp. NPDC046473 TaxID=3155733 RepID=UPI0033CD85AC